MKKHESRIAVEKNVLVELFAAMLKANPEVSNKRLNIGVRAIGIQGTENPIALVELSRRGAVVPAPAKMVPAPVVQTPFPVIGSAVVIQETGRSIDNVPAVVYGFLPPGVDPRGTVQVRTSQDNRYVLKDFQVRPLV